MQKEDLKNSRRTRVEQGLIENFVMLQKAVTNLTFKLDNVATKLDRLLDIFEESAKALGEGGINFVSEQKEIKRKLDQIIERQKPIISAQTSNMAVPSSQNY